MSISSHKVSLGEVNSICASLGSLMQALMDQNAMALIVGSTGEVTFTKQGTKVLSEASYSHPIEKLIINACNRYHLKTGDDCKLFLLLLKEMMHGVKRMLAKHDDIYVRRTLSLEAVSLVSFLPHLFENTRNISAVVSNPSDSFELFCKDLNGIITTFTDSRFPCNVSKVLSGLIYQFLVSSVSNWKEAGQALEYLILHFDVFCSKALRPLCESSILKGFLLHQRFISSLESMDDLRFVIIWDVSQKRDDVCWSVEVDSLPVHLNHLWKQVEKSLINLKYQGVSAILTPGIACENFRSLCSQCEITIIDNVPSEDVDNIVFFTAVSPMDSLNVALEPKNIASIKSIKSVAFNKFHYTHLDISADRNSIVPNHILLCALTDSLWKQYYSEFYNCLKVVKQWLIPSFDFFHKIQSKAKQLSSLVDCQNKCIVEQLKIESDYQQRFNYSETLCGIQPDKSSASESCDFGLSFPLGLWEFAFKMALTNASSCKQSFPHLCNILDSAFLQSACQMWNIPLRNYEGLKSYSCFHKKVKGKEDTPIIPVLSKEDQLLEVLHLLQQLLKIDAIVSSK